MPIDDGVEGGFEDLVETEVLLDAVGVLHAIAEPSLGHYSSVEPFTEEGQISKFYYHTWLQKDLLFWH